MSAPVFAAFFAALWLVSFWWMGVTVKADVDLPKWVVWLTLIVFFGSAVGFATAVAWAVFA